MPLATLLPSLKLSVSSLLPINQRRPPAPSLVMVKLMAAALPATLARRLWCCSALLALMVACLAVDGPSINCDGGGECSSSEMTAEQFENGRTQVEDLRPMDSAAAAAVAASLERDFVGWEMRRVPSGPDPLHHNGSPKKPHTP